MSNKTQGYLTNIKVSLPVTETGVAITSITSTKPAVVESALELETNDCVLITGAIPNRINGKYAVQVKTSGSDKLVTLLGNDGDFTGIGGIDLSNAKIVKIPMSGYCQSKSVNVSMYETSTENSTTLCDEEEQTESTSKPGSCSLDNFYRDDNEVTERLRLAIENNEEIIIQMQHGKGGRVRSWRAIVTKFDYQAQVGNKMTNAIDFKFNTFPIEASK